MNHCRTDAQWLSAIRFSRCSTTSAVARAVDSSVNNAWKRLNSLKKRGLIRPTDRYPRTWIIVGDEPEGDAE